MTTTVTDTFTGERHRAAATPIRDRRSATRLRLGRAAAGCSVLDAGCGEGYGASMLAQ
jgi:hypothetical protein